MVLLSLEIGVVLALFAIDEDFAFADHSRREMWGEARASAPRRWLNASLVRQFFELIGRDLSARLVKALRRSAPTLHGADARLNGFPATRREFKRRYSHRSPSSLASRIRNASSGSNHPH